MRRRALIAAAVAVPLLLVAVVWQGGRYAALAAAAKRVEAEERTWVDENRKLDSSVRVLSSREKAEERAERLGLEKAAPDRRLRIEGAEAGGSAAGESGTGRAGGGRQ